MDNLIAKLYQSPKTILTNKDLALIWGETNLNNLKAKIAYYVKRGVLIRLTRNVFAKDANYNAKELATSIYTPSYISFETVLREAGTIFQHYENRQTRIHFQKTERQRALQFGRSKERKQLQYRDAGEGLLGHDLFVP